MKLNFIIPYFGMLCLLCYGCTTHYEEPEVSLADYQIEEGFELSMVAAEPFLEAPVAIDFDLKGRIWVAEMRGYMTNINNDGENLPSGTISILEDLDEDGVVDHSKIFLEGLVMPRALALVYGGLLYAEPPNLWFVEIEDDTPGEKILVDSLYADDGNVEHQPNGLMMNIDNWIYNAKSHFRYQRKNGVWRKEPTSFRGQWGITKDNFGRLYYNNNSVLLQGDFVLPNLVIANQYYRPQFAVGKSLTANQRVYPLHATSVNRGYQKGVLDQDSMLVNATSACGPMVYRGGQFPDAYFENAFVCAPEANLIKRHLLSFDQIQTTGEQAWKDKEFLASTDEAFRPVNLVNGPDGAMYVVDMHRGIIQHGAYMSPYLREQLEKKGLDQVIGMGRILKVKSKHQPLLKIPEFTEASTTQLIEMLYHPNGWVRDKAQQILILNGDKSDISELEKVALHGEHPIAQTHALRVLEGLDVLHFDLLLQVAKISTASVVAHTLVLFKNPISEEQKIAQTDLFTALLAKNDPVIDLYVLAAIGKSKQYSKELLPAFVSQLTARSTDPVALEMIVSILEGQEEKFIEGKSNQELKRMLTLAVANRTANRKNWIYELASVAEDDRTRGMRFFKNICAACHGTGGTGIENLAPPLIDSEYVAGSTTKLALVILHGLRGPVRVNGTRYEFNAEMPGIASTTEMSDQDIVDLIKYLSNAFGKPARKIDTTMVNELRKVTPSNGAFTEEELNTLMNR